MQIGLIYVYKAQSQNVKEAAGNKCKTKKKGWNGIWERNLKKKTVEDKLIGKVWL